MHNTVQSCKAIHWHKCICITLALVIPVIQTVHSCFVRHLSLVWLFVEEKVGAVPVISCRHLMATPYLHYWPSMLLGVSGGCQAQLQSWNMFCSLDLIRSLEKFNYGWHWHVHQH